MSQPPQSEIPDMEETKVIIVGAGPSGLALGAYLSAMDIEVRAVNPPHFPFADPDIS